MKKRLAVGLALILALTFGTVGIAEAAKRLSTSKAAKVTLNVGEALSEVAAEEGIELYDMEVSECERRSRIQVTCVLDFGARAADSAARAAQDDDDFEAELEDDDGDGAVECQLPVRVKLNARGRAGIKLGEIECE